MLPACLGTPRLRRLLADPAVWGAVVKTRLRRFGTGGSLAISPMPLADARPRHQAGDAAPTPSRSSIAAVVVVVAAAVGPVRVFAGARPREQAGDAASSTSRPPIAAAVVDAVDAIGRGPVTHRLAPVAVVARLARTRTPLKLASAPVIDTVPVARSRHLPPGAT